MICLARLRMFIYRAMMRIGLAAGIVVAISNTNALTIEVQYGVKVATFIINLTLSPS